LNLLSEVGRFKLFTNSNKFLFDLVSIALIASFSLAAQVETDVYHQIPQSWGLFAKEAYTNKARFQTKLVLIGILFCFLTL